MVNAKAYIGALAGLLVALMAGPAMAMDGIGHGGGGGAPPGSDAYGAVSTALTEEGDLVSDAALNRLAEPPSEGSKAWIEGLGGTGEIEPEGTTTGVTDDIAGALAGFDADLGGHWRMGALIAYTTSNLAMDPAGAEGDGSAWRAGLYAGAAYGHLVLRLGGGFSESRVGVTRTATAFAELHPRLLQLFAEAGYTFPAGPLSGEVFAGGGWRRLTLGGVEETGSGATFDGPGGRQETQYAELGLRLGPGGDQTWRPHLQLAWRRTFGDLAPLIDLGSATAGGPALARDALVAKADVAFGVGRGGALAVFYNGVIGDHDSFQVGGLRYSQSF